jgi:single-strand DNA-binding protein
MYQKLIIIGNLGGNPEQRFTPDGSPVTTFSVATSRKVKDQDETTWFRVTVWNKQAESCNQYLHKGSKVLVEGRLSPGTDGGPKVFQRKDGTWGASYEVTAETVRFLSGKADEPADVDVPF